MFASKQRGTVIAEGLRIVGTVTAEGLVSDRRRTTLHFAHYHSQGSRDGHDSSRASRCRRYRRRSDSGGRVFLKSQAHVVGDIHHQSLAMERGAFFDGRSVQIRGNGQTPGKLERKSARKIANRETPSSRIERAEPVEVD
jgi:hypothetical protein